MLIDYIIAMYGINANHFDHFWKKIQLKHEPGDDHKNRFLYQTVHFMYINN